MQPLNYNHTTQDYYNYTDLNRVDDWTKAIHTKLLDLGYNAPISTRAAWKYGDYPTVGELARIRNNINSLRNHFFSPPEWRELKVVYREDGRETITAEQVNAQEWDLQMIDNAIESMLASYPYAGEWNAGEA